ncbi:hypothetical protein [Mycoplasma suis]|uniref:Uncharacterized protein n=1 Tax=Mycoplasma suis (strain Illinois) TaxID=768700 RepID=F0QRP7_MYCSL|nr:hypothetical protein [Mycoplasma suis]ADX98167.1 hypothetical protein MSU_0636 [Mycoplasma suis str. Illinois]
MFTFSKVITLGVLLAGTSGLSAYLIPYEMGSTAAQDTLFSNSNPFAENKNSKEFKEEEDQKLKILKPLLEKLEEAVKNSETFRDLKNQEMIKLFQSISQSENKLTQLYEESSSILQKLSENLKRITDINENRMKFQSFLSKSIYWRNLLNEIDKFLKARKNLLDSVVSEIEKNESSQSSNSNSSSAGGGHSRRKAERKQRGQKLFRRS